MYGIVFTAVGLPYLLVYGGPMHALFTVLAFTSVLTLLGYSWVWASRKGAQLGSGEPTAGAGAQTTQSVAPAATPFAPTATQHPRPE
jgi:hypothetical protein